MKPWIHTSRATVGSKDRTWLGLAFEMNKKVQKKVQKKVVNKSEMFTIKN